MLSHDFGFREVRVMQVTFTARPVVIKEGRFSASLLRIRAYFTDTCDK